MPNPPFFSLANVVFDIQGAAFVWTQFVSDRIQSAFGQPQFVFEDSHPVDWCYFFADSTGGSERP